MIFSTQLIVYAAAGLLLALLPLLSMTGIWPLLGWLAAGLVWFYLQMRELEKGLAMFSDMDAFWRYAASCRFSNNRVLLKRIGGQIQGLSEQYSADMVDISAQIGSLQSQINPHFLYNTLESIRSEAILRDCPSIAKMSKALGQFFRYSISQKENIVTIQGELDNIRNYFIIQNYRFGNKFQLDICIEENDDDVLDCLIPKMTLQPIVENSIFHGLEAKPEQGRVQIRLAMTEDKVILSVSDDGIGMSAEQLEQLRRNIDKPPAYRENGRSNGIALYNVDQKLRLIFGSAYSLQVYSTKGLGTDVEIFIPMRRDRNALPL